MELGKRKKKARVEPVVDDSNIETGLKLKRKYTFPNKPVMPTYSTPPGTKDGRVYPSTTHQDPILDPLSPLNPINMAAAAVIITDTAPSSEPSSHDYHQKGHEAAHSSADSYSSHSHDHSSSSSYESSSSSSSDYSSSSSDSSSSFSTGGDF